MWCPARRKDAQAGPRVLLELLPDGKWLARQDDPAFITALKNVPDNVVTGL